jgi:hypothetical protein
MSYSGPTSTAEKSAKCFGKFRADPNQSWALGKRNQQLAYGLLGIVRTVAPRHGCGITLVLPLNHP